MAKANRLHDYLLPSIDALAAFASMAASFVLRLDPGPALHAYSQRLVVASLAAAFIKPAIFSAMGLYSVYWRYVSPAEVRSVLGACATGSIALVAGAAFIQSWFPGLRGIPPSVFAIDFLATILAVGLLRFVANGVMVHEDAGRQRV
jgi:FlaA1/EpsC-like NDP-sugar epimerase